MDKSYWNKYYSKKLGVQEHSSFAVYVLKMMSDGDSILELGCGEWAGFLFLCRARNSGICPGSI